MQRDGQTIKRPRNWGASSCANGLVVALLINASCGSPQEFRKTEELELGGELRTLERPFTRVSGLVESDPGMVMVADEAEKTVQLFDLRNSSIRTVGRIGRGPSEYLRPRELLRFRSDSVLLHDSGNGRFLVVSHDGTPGRVIAIPDWAAGEVVGADGEGRIYLRTHPGVSGSERNDSTRLLRWNPDAEAVDTLLSLQEATQSIRVIGPSQETTALVIPTPFSPEDGCIVTLGGDVVVARAHPFRVEWWSGARLRKRGPVQPYDPVKVTAADRRPYERPGFQVAFEWPEHKPPFMRRHLFTSRDARRIWLRRTTSNGDTARYDVFGRTGELIVRVRLPGRRRVVGIGHEHIFVARADEMDLQWIEVYPDPLAR